MLTASMLFAGDRHEDGPHRCFMCGAFCGEKYTVEEYIKDTFTNRDDVKFPGASFLCVGCVEAMGGGEDAWPLIDGTTKERTNNRGMAPRMYSWVITEKEKKAGTKAHIKEFRETILSPPNPPFCIVLTDSGQKHFIFKSLVATSREAYPVCFDGENIIVRPEELKRLLSLCTKISAALGKVALVKEIPIALYAKYYEVFGETETLEEWLSIRDRPLSRLAGWLSPNKEDAQDEYSGLERGDVQAGIGGASGQEPTDGERRTGHSDGRGGQVLLFSSGTIF